MTQLDAATSQYLTELGQRIQLLEAYITHLYRTAGVVMPSAQEVLAGQAGVMGAGGPLPAGGPMVSGGPTGGMTPEMLEIQAIARSGNKIEAIKRYRQLTGADLGEAKGIVDSWYGLHGR